MNMGINDIRSYYLPLSLLLFTYIISTGSFASELSKVSAEKQVSQMITVRTVSDVRKRYGPKARKRLIPLFEEAGISYPPEKVTFLTMKDRHVLELWAAGRDSMKFIKRYYIWSASGEAGPKLAEGDKQVPEGIYKVIRLNPNSNYHLSMQLNYPNQFDLKWAKADKRNNLGGDIYIHGKSYSIGCLAMGDKNIEELFILASDVGISNIDVVIAPRDPRFRPLKPKKGSPEWVSILYQELDEVFSLYK